MSEKQSGKPQVLIVSVVIGALLGLLAGFLYLRIAEESGGPGKISTGKALKLAVSAIGVVRQASLLGG